MEVIAPQIDDGDSLAGLSVNFEVRKCESYGGRLVTKVVLVCKVP